jgi:GTP-binding protein EngB required for normal cell division
MLDWDKYQFGCGNIYNIIYIYMLPQPGIDTQSIRTISDYNTSVIILILKMDKVCSFENGIHLQN